MANRKQYFEFWIKELFANKQGERLKQSPFFNWMKACLALKITSEGLQRFVIRSVLKVHDEIMNHCKIGGVKCCECSTPNIIPCQTDGFCLSGDSFEIHDDVSTQYRPCPKGVCDKIRDHIIGCHVNNAPNWANTNAKRWCFDYWEIGKCFIETDGYKMTTQARTTDFNDVISILRNCNRCHEILSKHDGTIACLLLKIQDIALRVTYTKDFIISGDDLQKMIDMLSQLLNIVSLEEKKASPSKISNLLLKQLESSDYNFTEQEIAYLLQQIILTFLQSFNTKIQLQEPIPSNRPVRPMRRQLSLYMEQTQEIIKKLPENKSECILRIITQNGDERDKQIEAVIQRQARWNNDRFNESLNSRRVNTNNFSAFSFSCATIQGIINRCKNNLNGSSLTQRELNILDSTSMIVYATATLSQDIWDGFEGENQREHSTIKIHDEPVLIVAEYNFQEAVFSFIKQNNIKELCSVMLVDDEARTQGKQRNDDVLIVYSLPGNLMENADALLERFAFRILKRLIESARITFDSAPNFIVDMDETILVVCDGIHAAYRRSEVPREEWPVIPDFDVEYPPEIDKIITTVLKIPGVFGCSKKRVGLFIDINVTDDHIRESISKNVSKIMDENRIRRFVCRFCTFKHLSVQSGDPIDVHGAQGTLGGFAEKRHALVKSPPCQTTEVRGNTEETLYFRDENKLVALISGHLSFLDHPPEADRTRYLTSCSQNKIIGQFEVPDQEEWIDMVCVEVYDEFRGVCETKFRNEYGVSLFADLIEHKSLENWEFSPVHIWGAKTSPGSGQILETNYVVDEAPGKFIVISERKSDKLFSTPGDSGSIVCGTDRTKRFFAIAMLIGEIQSKDEKSPNRYLALVLKDGLNHIAKKCGCEFSLCKASS